MTGNDIIKRALSLAGGNLAEFTALTGDTIIAMAADKLSARIHAVSACGESIVERARKLAGAATFPSTFAMTGEDVILYARDMLKANDFPSVITATGGGVVLRAYEMLGDVGERKRTSLEMMVRLLNDAIQDILTQQPYLTMQADGAISAYAALTSSTYNSASLPFNESLQEAAAHYVAARTFELDGTDTHHAEMVAMHRAKYADLVKQHNCYPAIMLVRFLNDGVRDMINRHPYLMLGRDGAFTTYTDLTKTTYNDAEDGVLPIDERLREALAHYVTARVVEATTDDRDEGNRHLQRYEALVSTHRLIPVLMFVQALNDGIRDALNRRPWLLYQSNGTLGTFTDLTLANYDTAILPFDEYLQESLVHFVAYRILEVRGDERAQIHFQRYESSIAQANNYPMPLMVHALNDAVHETTSKFPHLLIQADGTGGAFTDLTTTTYTTAPLPFGPELKNGVAEHIASALLLLQGNTEAAGVHRQLFNEALHTYKRYPLVVVINHLNDCIQELLYRRPYLLMQDNGSMATFTELSTSTYDSTALPFGEELRDGVARHLAARLLGTNPQDENAVTMAQNFYAMYKKTT